MTISKSILIAAIFLFTAPVQAPVAAVGGINERCQKQDLFHNRRGLCVHWY